MVVHAVTPILNVSDVKASQDWFQQLGWRAGFTWPDDSPEPGFGAVGSGDCEVFLCRGAQGSRGTVEPKFPGDDETDGVWMSWWVGSRQEVDELYARCLELGYRVTYPPTDEPWGVREFHLRHPDGHVFRVSAS